MQIIQCVRSLALQEYGPVLPCLHTVNNSPDKESTNRPKEIGAYINGKTLFSQSPIIHDLEGPRCYTN